MPEKLQFRDRREMQLFAEQVLQYRFPDKSFQSFGYHQPNVDQHRKVFTVTDNTVYYFLPTVTSEAVAHAIADIESLLKKNPLMDFNGSANLIKSAVLVGEYQPMDGAPPDAATIEAMDQALSSYSGPLDIGLSYIDEDLYWDVRRDRIDANNGGSKTPVTEILATIKSTPPVATLTDRPRYLNRPMEDRSAPTEIADPGKIAALDQTEIDLALPDPEDQVQHDPQPHVEASRLGWMDGVNSLVMLAGVTLLGLIGGWFLWKGLPQLANPTLTQPSATSSTPSATSTNLPVPTPPPGGSSQSQSFDTRNTSKNPQPSASQSPPVNQPPTRTAQAQQPASLWLVQSPSNGYNAVNLRSGPGSGYSAIGAIRQGNYVVDAGEQVGNWRKVSYYNKVGWVYSSFIR